MSRITVPASPRRLALPLSNRWPVAVAAAARAAAFESLAGCGLQLDVCDLRSLSNQLQLPANRIWLDVPEVDRQEGDVHACDGSDFGFEVSAMLAICEGDLERSDRERAKRACHRDRADERTGERPEATRCRPLLNVGHAFRVLPPAIAQSQSCSS